ncbi:uncharacterized protein LOC110839661 [Zootermopsis nevadensis]|uniref:CHK kinase-like domain-containing protein n=1 Tax=Zootermopsis nevadensis TaxID=136037 RepID=A0A067QK84_ZOONE|nr:uncharacterized protein LOC110839661 [Zootermopsis nevadensis]KDR08234.1 hypothetical protein L798_01952 [Zootermopsis nevadensis]
MSDSEDESSGEESQVTSEWLEAILVSYHQQELHHGVGDCGGGNDEENGEELCVNIGEFSVGPGCDAGECVLSDILAVRVQYRVSPGTPDPRILSLIVKLLPHDPFSRFFVTEAQFDLREIKFYTQVVPELEQFQKRSLPPDTPPLELPIPRCYHARYTPGKDSPNSSPIPSESVLVLENLKSRGFQGADFSRGLTLRQAESALEAVARVHALSLALKVKEGRPLVERYPFLFQTARATDSYQQLVERGLPQLARFLERRPGLEDILECLLTLRPNTKELIASLLTPEEPLALITHTDFWCNNLLFRDDVSCSCAVLDWQMVTYSRPTNDVALLLISSLPTELRRRHTTSLLDGYWAALTGSAMRLGVDVEGDLGHSRVALGEDYRRSQLLALLLCIGSVDVALGDPLTEQRLLDVLQDLHKDGVLSSDIITTAAQ